MKIKPVHLILAAAGVLAYAALSTSRRTVAVRQSEPITVYQSTYDYSAPGQYQADIRRIDNAAGY